jgi:hypothetical protein
MTEAKIKRSTQTLTFQCHGFRFCLLLFLFPCIFVPFCSIRIYVVLCFSCFVLFSNLSFLQDMKWKKNTVAQTDHFSFCSGSYVSSGSIQKGITTDQAGSLGNAPDFYSGGGGDWSEFHGRRIGYPEIFRGCPQSLQACPGLLLQIGHDRFLPGPG